VVEKWDGAAAIVNPASVLRATLEDAKAKSAETWPHLAATGGDIPGRDLPSDARWGASVG